jgi:hypothetical protein
MKPVRERAKHARGSRRPRGPRPFAALFAALLAAALTIAVIILPTQPATARVPAGVASAATGAAILADYDNLRAFITPLGALLPRRTHNAMLRRLAASKAAFTRGRICPAGDALRSLYAQTKHLERGDDAIAGELGNLARALRQRVLAESTVPCRAAERVNAEPGTQVLASDNQSLQVAVSFGEARTWTVHENGQAFTEVSLPGIEHRIGEPGQPAVPVWRRLIAAPRGARVDVSLVGTPEIAERLDLLLLPYRGQPVDQVPDIDRSAFADLPFVIDDAAYASDADFPDYDIRVAPLGSVRDLELYQVEIPVGHYNPVDGVLTLYERIEWLATFTGGGGFVTERARSPFEHFPGGLDRAVLNAGAVYEHVEPYDPGFLTCSGEELLILSPAAFLDAAIRLRDHKRDIGISTNVVEVPAGASVGTVDALIETRWNNCLVRPSYALLLGDVETIPTRYEMPQNEVPPDLGCGKPRATDFYYGVIGPLYKFVQDVGIGRIPANDLAEADLVVDKIIAYESSPPTKASFYEQATAAGAFECCRHPTPPEYPFAPPAVKAQLLAAWHAQYDGVSKRSYIASAEYARNVLLGEGYEVERLYVRYVDPPEGETPPYSFDATPRRYYDLTPLPQDIGPDSAFYWSAVHTNSIKSAFNEGRFLMFHRDHGWYGGWADPAFTLDHLGDLSNGALQPFVFSVNCATGAFDSETAEGECAMPVGQENFAERLLINPHGAVGIIAASRNSPTWENSTLLLGLTDAVWPDALPGFGDGVSQRRLADILNHGKGYLLEAIGTVPLPGGSIEPGDVYHQLEIYHAFGDPTLRIWRRNPHTVLLDTTFGVTTGADALEVAYAVEGAEITAMQQLPATGEVRHIGRGVVEGGVATLSFVEDPEPGEPVVLSAGKDDSVSIRLGNTDVVR